MVATPARPLNSDLTVDLECLSGRRIDGYGGVSDLRKTLAHSPFFLVVITWFVF